MAAPSRTGRWLYGAGVDTLLGCGLLHIIVISIYAWGGAELRALHPAYLLPLLVMVFSMPHYGATLVRVYEHREDRRGYAIFSIHATIALAILFVWGLYDAFVGSLLLTVYLTWSPWHYSGQNYGLSVMFLRRRGVDVSPAAKRLLYGSFLLSYALVFLVFHAYRGATAYDIVTRPGGALQLLSLGIPEALGDVLFVLAGGGYAFCTLGALVLLRRAGSWRDLGPSLVLLVTQATWFTIPYAIRGWGFQTGIEPLDQQFAIRDYVFFIAFAHAIQYLWVTSYYARSAKGWRGAGRYFAKTAGAGIAIWTLPVVVFAPHALGTLSYDVGLAMMLATIINLHHFVLDGAIWKLRNQRIASILLRRSDPADAAGQASSGWRRRAVWSVATAGGAIALFTFQQVEVAYPAAVERSDFAEARRVLDRVAVLGRDSAARRRAIGEHYEARGEIDIAIGQYERSVALDPVPGVYADLGRLLGTRGDWDEALAAFQAGLEVEPGHRELLRGAGIAWRETERRSTRSLGAPAN